MNKTLATASMPPAKVLAQKKTMNEAIVSAVGKVKDSQSRPHVRIKDSQSRPHVRIVHGTEAYVKAFRVKVSWRGSERPL